MLTDPAKQQILEEELYRREIRTQLEMGKPKESKRQKYWAFVNSGVFIWFLSSIVLGSASFLYTTWDKQHAVERENQRKADMLDIEIANRLAYFSHLMKMRATAFEEWKKIGRSQSIDDYDLSKAVLALERPSATDYPSNAFSELSHRNLRSLLWELMQIVSRQDSCSILPAYKKSFQLQLVYLKNLYGSKRPMNGGIISAFQARALAESNIATQEFYATFNLPRWGCVFDELLEGDHATKNRGR